jgi:hypothetical protein
MRRVGVAALCTLLISLSLGATARGATLTVDSTADSGAGSLREAISEANSDPHPDRIEFPAKLGGTIALQRALPTITAPLSIDGPGADQLSLAGQGDFGLLEIDLPEAGPVEIGGLTLRGGAGETGGAIASTDADLVLEHMALTGNRAKGFGGALAVRGGSLTLLSSRIEGNRARLAGGAVRVRGAGLNVVVSTIARNSAGKDGGGVSIAASDGGLLIEGSTIAGNRSAGDGGAIALGGAPRKALSVSGSKLLANRAAGRGGALFSAGGTPPTLEGTRVDGNASGDGGPAVVRPKGAGKRSDRRHRAPRLPASAGTNGSWSPSPADARIDSIIAEPLTAAPGSISIGPTATLLGGVALAPPGAPPAIEAVIAAANQISHTPYIWGGGHGSWDSPGYDCSGAVSFALHGGGFLAAPLASGQLESWGAPGPGRWLTVYANATHAYAVIAGLRWDTVGDARGSGPRWHLSGAYPEGFVARHPPGY